MSEYKDTVRLLVISSQVESLNKVLSLLRSQGLELKAAGANSRTELLEQLNSQPWDLVLCCEGAGVEPPAVMALIAEQGLELPLIILHNRNTGLNPAQVYRSAVRDFIIADDHQHICFAIHRELAVSGLGKAYRLLNLDYRELHNRHQALLDKSGQPLAYILEGMHLYCNQSYARFFDFGNTDELQQTPLLDLFSGESRDKLRTFLGELSEGREALTLPLSTLNGEAGQQTEAQEIELQFAPVTIEGQPGLQLTLHPVSGNSNYREQLKASNNRDLLTRLFNAESFREKVENAIARAIKQQGQSCVLLVQVNEFLDIKSTIGAGKANLILTDIAAFLQKSVQRKFAAARLSDYEFGLLLQDCSPVEAMAMAEFIKSKINNHITTTTLPSLQLSCSIGIAAVNEHARDTDELLARARANLEIAVHGSSHQDALQNPEASASDIDMLTACLDRAIADMSFKLLFQPVVDLKNNNFRFYEILSRMLDEQGNDILPGTYIPLANLNGSGEALDKAVVSLALDAITGVKDPALRLIISLTSTSLLNSTFLPWLSKTLHERHISAEHLIFQLSEIQICNSPEYCIQFCRGLEQLGLQSIICHYGCVVDPVNYLDNVRPYYVKLDKALVRDLDYSQYHQDELRNMIKKLHERNFKVIVPQVEDHSTLPLLWKLGADFVQGYSLERPRQTMSYNFIQNHEITLLAPVRKS